MDSMEPLAKEMMTRSLQTFQREIDRIRNKKTPICVETVDETTGDVVDTTLPRALCESSGEAQSSRLDNEVAEPNLTANLIANDRSPPPRPVDRPSAHGTRWNVAKDVRTALQTGQPVGAPDGSNSVPLRPTRQSTIDRSDRGYDRHSGNDRHSGYDRAGYDRSDHGRFDPTVPNPYQREKNHTYFRKSATPLMITATDAQTMKKEYCSFQDFCTVYDVPMIEWSQLHAEITSVYPPSADASKYQMYSKMIYQKLEEEGSMDTRGNNLLMGLMAQHNGTRDGYAVIKEMVRRYAVKHNKADSAPRNIQPIFDGNIFNHAGDLTDYYEYQAQQGRYWEPVEKTTLYLEAIKHDEKYGTYAQDILRTLRERPTSTPMEIDYELDSLPTTLTRACDQMKSATNPYTINAMRSGRDSGRGRDNGRDHGRDHGRDSNRGRDSDRGRDSERGVRKEWKSKDWKSTDGKPQRDGERRQRKHVQCAACGVYGHDSDNCHVCPKILCCLQFERKQPEKAKRMIEAHRKKHNPTNQQSSAQRKVMNQLMAYLDDDSADDMGKYLLAKVATLQMYDEEDDDLRDPYPEVTSDDDNALHDHSTEDQNENFDKVAKRMQVTVFPSQDIADHCASAQSVILPSKEILHRSTQAPGMQRLSATSAQATRHREPTESSRRIIRKLMRFDPRTGKLTDSGANCSATSERHLIHSYQHGSRYNITDFRNVVKPATGEGYILMENCEGNIDKIFVLYDPDVEGTIISPEHHTVTNPHIHRWVQSSVPSENGGQILYYDKEGNVLSSYNTIRHDGLYYMKQTTIHPPAKVNAFRSQSLETPPTAEPLDTIDDWQIEGAQDGDLNADWKLELDMMQADLEDWQHVMTIKPPAPIDDPIECHCVHKMKVQTLTPTEEALLEYERWHQRFGHVGRDKLKQTAKWSEGMPDIDLTKAVPPDIHHCRSCAKGKMQKAPKGSNLDTSHLKPGQRLQMDLGFMRGPSNLQEVVEREAKPKMRIIKSRQGFTSYLLIIDAKTRYIWVFLLRSKHAPVKLIDRFLATHGRHDNTEVCTIRTDGDGALAASADFRVMCLHNHGYVVEPTGPDSSSQNGRGERPHKTLAIMVRCMLYGALLGVDFWADALVYAVYLYVRLHHSAINMTPIFAYTGKKARCDHIRTFGSYVTVKRPGDRNTKLDPNHYDGRFLRFSATEKNIVYYDEVTGKEKLARHLTMDEFHYGANERPPGAQALMDILGPNNVIGGSKMKETPVTVEAATTPTHAPKYFGSEMMDDKDTDSPAIPSEPPPIAAAAAKLTVAQEFSQSRILHMEHSNDMFGAPIPVELNIREKNPHPHLGFQFRSDPATDRLYLETCIPRSTASKIPRWRSRFRFANLQTVDGNRIQSLSHLTDYIAKARKTGVQQLRFVFAKLETCKSEDDGVPQLHLDQLRLIRRLQTELRVAEAKSRLHRKPPLSPEDQDHFDQANQKKFSRKNLQKRADFQLWKAAEWAQHDKYAKQNMFGAPIPRPRDATVLPWVWQRHWKEDATALQKGEFIRKCRATCDGGPRYGRAVTLAETYATCIEQSASRVFWALVAVLGMVAHGADAGNAFAEAPPPVAPFYMEVDDAYREWWTEHKGNAPIPDGYVLPVQHALQGHPESPRLWEKHITKILADMGYVATTHERCLYHRTTDDGELILIIRQVDDFAVAATDQTLVAAEITKIGEELLVPLNHLGLIKKFNGVDILQTRDFVKVSCESYISKVIETHGWQDLVTANKPIPMRSDSKYMAMLETSEVPATDAERKELEKQMQFSFRSVIGELVFAMVIARPDMSFTITKLSQWNKNPAKCHYQAAKQACAYLNATKEDGLVYWRTTPRDDLPFVEHPKPVSNPNDTLPQIPMDPTKIVSLTDSDWGSDRATRRSVSGMIIMLAGAAVLYRTKFQPTIALSSTEAEFVAGSDTGKATLYLRSILHELGLTQVDPTQIFQDNHGAIHMANAQAPTRRTRHVELRHFAILQWVENGDVTMVSIGTDNNHSDAMTKAIGRTKFHQHADVYMGKVPPTYVTDGTLSCPPKVQRLSAQPNCLIHATFDPEI